MVFVKEFQWDQRPQPLQNGLFTITQKKTPITEVETQLFPINLKCPRCPRIFSGGPPTPRPPLDMRGTI